MARRSSSLVSLGTALMLVGACTGSPLPASADELGESEGSDEPDAPPEIQLFEVHPAPIKRYDFEWLVDGAQTFELLERAEPDAAFEPVDATLDETGGSLVVPLHLRAHASYMLRACNDLGCSESAPVEVGALEPAIGFIKSPAPQPESTFGRALALSGDGRTLAVRENMDEGWTTIVHVYVHDDAGGAWSLDTSLMPGAFGDFNEALALSGDGRTLVIGATNQAGAAFIYERNQADDWFLAATIEASNADDGDDFGQDVALAAAGDTLIVGARHERSFPEGADSDPEDDSATLAGAAYVFERGLDGNWTEARYLKEHTHLYYSEQFGRDVEIDAEGQTLVVATLRIIYTYERVADDWMLVDELSFGNDGPGFFDMTLSPDGQWMALSRWNDDVDGVHDAGRSVVYRRAADGAWELDAELAAPYPGEQDQFGRAAVFDHDASLLLIGAGGEDSPATGVDGPQAGDTSQRSGAAYLFERQGEAWSLRSYLKAPNTGSPEDLAEFGFDLAISADGETAAIGAYFESSAATGVQGVPEPDEVIYLAGAMYLF